MDIRARRNEAGLRLEELADKSGISLRRLKEAERGLSELLFDEAVAVAAVLGGGVEDLLASQAELHSRAERGEGYVTRQLAEGFVAERSQQPPSGTLKALDLFCGSGGFSHGFEQSGAFAVTAGIDLLPDRAGTYRANHPYADVITGDIRTFPVSELVNRAGAVDVVIGGPPCQGFSSIRPFRDLGRGDARNNLFEEFALVVGELTPEWFVLENVVGLLTHQKGETFKRLLETFRTLDYTLDWRVVNAAQFGLPQNRERLLLVGSKQKRPFDWPVPTHEVEHRSMAGRTAQRLPAGGLFTGALRTAVTVREALNDLPPIRSGEESTVYWETHRASEYANLMRGDETTLTLHQATAHSDKMLEIIRLAGSNRNVLPPGLVTSGFSSSYSRLDGTKPSVTLTVNFVHPASNKCIHPDQDRALTPREGARLQGFPDSFKFLGTRSQIVKQIGNAVPPLLGRVVADAIAMQVR